MEVIDLSRGQGSGSSLPYLARSGAAVGGSLGITLVILVIGVLAGTAIILMSRRKRSCGKEGS